MAVPNLASYLPQELTGFRKLLPGALSRYQQAVASAQERYQADVAAHERSESIRRKRYADAVEARQRKLSDLEAERQKKLAQAQAEYERQLAGIQQQKAAAQNARIDRFQQESGRGSPDAIVTYFTLILEASHYPANFPRHVRLAYVPESRQVVVDLDLPSVTVLQEAGSFEYIRTKTQRKELYLICHRTNGVTHATRNI